MSVQEKDGMQSPGHVSSHGDEEPTGRHRSFVLRKGGELMYRDTPRFSLVRTPLFDNEAVVDTTDPSIEALTRVRFMMLSNQCPSMNSLSGLLPYGRPP